MNGLPTNADRASPRYGIGAGGTGPRGASLKEMPREAPAQPPSSYLHDGLEIAAPAELAPPGGRARAAAERLKGATGGSAPRGACVSSRANMRQPRTAFPAVTAKRSSESI